MKKKVLAFLMLGSLVISTLVGCNSNNATTANKNNNEESTNAVRSEEDSNDAIISNANLKEITVAVPMADTGTTFLNQLSYNQNNILGPAANVKFVYQQSTFDADGILTFVESQIAAGVDGLTFCPPSDSVLPTIATLCEEAGVYWCVAMRTIQDEDIRALCEASPYYVGNCYEDEEETGYQVGEFLGKQGVKKIAIITTTKGDTTGDAREVGLARACEEFGMKIAGEARGLTQASDITNAVESFLSANADLDVVFCVGTTVTGAQEVAVKAVQDSGRESVQVVTVDHPEGITALFETGILTYSIGVPSFALDTYICNLKVVNAIQGTPISGEKEGISSNFISMAAVTSLEEAKEYEAASGDNAYIFFDKEEIESMLGWNNPEFNEAALQTLLDNYEL